MKGFINGFDWVDVMPMKYWSFTSNTSDEVKRQTVRNAVFSGEYLGSIKRDGFYQRVVKDEDGNCFMIARSRNVNGEVVDKYDWVPHIHPWFDMLPNGSCFLVEAYLPNMEGSKNVTSILGCLKEKAISRQQKTPIHFHVFDCMAFNGYNFDKTPYALRAQMIRKIANDYKFDEYVHYAEFYEGQELWNKLQEYLSEGLEGMVIMRKDAIVYTKRTPARVSIKVKKELRESIDCFFTGRTTAPTKGYTGKEIENWQYWYNEHDMTKIEGALYKEYCTGATIVPVTKSFFYDFAGSLEIGVYDGDRVVPIGFLSGLTEEIKADPKKFAFKPIEVTAMELDFSNTVPSLRHGKFVQFRTDMDIKDCTLEKIIGNK